jgi:hypothetical protein
MCAESRFQSRKQKESGNKMAQIEVTSNNVPRLLLSWYELTPSEQSEFDYWNDKIVEIESGEVSPDFFRYRDNVYDLGDAEYIRPESGFPGEWSEGGYFAQTYFSGVIFRFAKDGNITDFDRVIVGRYFVPNVTTQNSNLV